MGDEPNVKQLPSDVLDSLVQAGLDEDEIKIITVYRFLHYGQMVVKKRFNRLLGHIEYRETF